MPEGLPHDNAVSDFERRNHIGHTWPPFDVTVEAGSATAFARGLDEDDPIYLDPAAAAAAGYAGIPTLPTFPIAISTARVDLIYDMLALLRVDASRILHAKQRFVHHQPLLVGDRLRGTKRIVDIADRKNGTLTFIETEIHYVNADGGLVCEDRCTLVARNG